MPPIRSRHVTLLGALAAIALTGSAPAQISFGSITTHAGVTGPARPVGGDFDGDGLQDIVTVSYTTSGGGGGLAFYRGNGSGGFSSTTTFTIGDGCRSVAAADFDNDGRRDFAITRELAGTVVVRRNTSTPGSFTSAAGPTLGGLATPTDVTAGDWDGDGRPDIVVLDGDLFTPALRVYRNTSTMPGTITFAAPVTLTLVDVFDDIELADFDGDGRQDAAMCYFGTSSARVVRNTSSSGSPSFGAATTISAGDPFRLAIGDLDGDGRRDLAFSSFGGTNLRVARNTSSSGTISFAAPTTVAAGGSPIGLAAVDLNGDGKAELAYTRGFLSSFGWSVLPNTSPSPGTITFGTRIDITASAASPDLIAHDLNGGGADLVSGQTNSNLLAVSLNTSDSTPPNPGTVGAVAFTQNGATISVPYSGAFDSGSGLASVQLWYRQGTAGTWTNSGLSLTTGSGTFNFTPPSGPNLYAFATRAQDVAGNFSATPTGDRLPQTLWDTTLPSIGGSLTSASPTNGTTATWSVTASEPASILAPPDFSLSQSGITGSTIDSATSTFQQMLNLNGSSQWLQLAPGFNYIPASNYTIEAWVFLRSHSSNCRLVDFGAGPNTKNVFVALSEGVTGRIEFGVHDGATKTNVLTSQTLPLNRWVHVAVTQNAGTARIYMNGVLVGENTAMQLVTRGAADFATSYIGRSNWAADSLADAQVDELRLWNSARTQDTIRAAMNTRATGTEPGLVGLWQMDGTIAAGTQIEDTSPNNNHATLSGAPALPVSTVPATSWTVAGTLGTGSSGTVAPSVLAAAVADLALNANAAFGPFGTVTIDRIAPTASLGTLPAITNATFFDNWPVSFSENVTGLALGDFSTSGITVSDLQGSGASYTIDLTLAPGDGPKSISLIAGAAQDAATNPSTAAGPVSTTLDQTPPSVTLPALPSITNQTFFDNVPVTFSETVVGFGLSDFTTSGITVSDLQGGGASYTVDLTLTGGDGPKTLSFNAAAVADAASNTNAAAGPVTVTLDTTPPVATLPSLPSVTNQTFFNDVAVTFTENVTGLALGDFATSGITVSDLQGGGASYTVDLTLAPGDGAKTLSLIAAAVADAASNTNPAAGPLTITLDQTPPTVAIAPISSPTNQATFDNVAVTFSEPVTGLTLADFTTSGVTISDLQGTGTAYTVDVTVAGTAEGLRAFAVAAAAAQDTAGNDSTASAPREFTFDGTAPVTSAIAPIGTVTQPGPILDVEWSGTDFLAFSVNLFYRFNGGPATLYGGPHSASPIAVDTGTTGGNGTYDFWTVGTDIAGNVEAPPGTPDITVIFNNNASEPDWTLLED